MEKSLFVTSNSKGEEIALLEDNKLVEFHQESSNKSYTVGDVYLGRIKRVNTSLNAVFVDVGHEKDAFLHYHDLGPQFVNLARFVKSVKEKKQRTASLNNFNLEPDIDKNGNVSKLFTKNQTVLVQVVKEPISTKGPRLTSEISLAGRYVVLVPFTNIVSVSKKIKESKERKRLKVLISSIKPANFGVIIRTAAEKVSVAELDQDIRNLVKKWEDAFKMLIRSKPPSRIVQEMDRAMGLLRDILTDSFTSIVIDNENIYQEVKSYIKMVSPEQEKIVKKYRGKTSLFENYGIHKQIKSSFGNTVTVPGGTYIIIEHTEAMHTIDVNSGNRPKSDDDQQTNILNVNLEAAQEIARQLRLRDMGGIVVIDFIDMRIASNRKLLHKKLHEFMENDRAKHTILPVSRFGLIQLTRERVRPEVSVKTAEVCAMCEGSGKVRPSILITDEIAQNLDYIIKEQNESKVSLHTHPFIAAFLTKKLFSIQWKWFFKYGKWIPIISESTYHLGQYQFFNSNDEAIRF